MPTRKRNSIDHRERKNARSAELWRERKRAANAVKRAARKGAEPEYVLKGAQ